MNIFAGTRADRAAFPLLFFVAALLAVPSVCYADFDSFISDPRTLDTLFPLSIYIMVVMIEAGLLTWRVGTVRYRLNLWRSAVCNFLSLIVSFAAMLAIIGPEAFNFDVSTLYILLALIIFFDALLLRLLYRKNGVGWKKAATLALGLNTVSCMAVIAFTSVLLYADSKLNNYLDHKRLLEWTNASVLDNETGYIYLLEKDKDGRLKSVEKFNVSANKWESLDKGVPNRSWDKWHVEGNLLGIYGMEECQTDLGVYRLPEFKPIIKIFGWYHDFRISPDMKKVAVIENEGDATHPTDKEGWSLYLGGKGHLKIFDLSTGEVIAEAPRMVLSGGLCWTSDSASVIFVSFENDALFFRDDGKLTVNNLLGIFPKHLFKYDIGKNVVTHISDGEKPQLVGESGEIAFLIGRDLMSYSPKTGKCASLLENVVTWEYSISPSGQAVVVEIPKRGSVRLDAYLTVVGVDDSNRHLIIKDIDKLTNYSIMAPYFFWTN